MSKSNALTGKPGENHLKKESDLAALTLAFKKALKLDTKKVNVDKCSPEVPAHVS